MKKLHFIHILIVLFSLTDPLISLPPAAQIQTDLELAYNQFKNVQEGENASYIPELKLVNSNYFAIVIATIDGEIYGIGDQNIPFAIESISKPFVYALALQDQGATVLEDKVGLNATGHAFNSILEIEELPKHKENPFVNAGAIQTTSLIKGKDSADKWDRVFSLFQKYSDGQLFLSEAVYKSEASTNKRNQAIALLLDSYDRIYSDPMDAVDRYTKACSIMVTDRQLAMMGATLANGGINPWSKKRIVPIEFISNILAEMSMNGLYEDSGAWWVHVGLPAKSGVGGGILAIVPNQCAIAAFSPLLDSAGNSVRAQKAIELLSKKWNLNLFSPPALNSSVPLDL